MPNKKAKISRHSTKKTGKSENSITFKAIQFIQGGQSLYIFKEDALKLWQILSINRRDSDKDEGYQRVLPNSRIQAVSKYVQEGHLIPNSLIVSFDQADYDEDDGTLTVPSGKDVGWVIDGQHRLAGAYEAAKKNGVQYEFCVVAAVGLSIEQQIELFITINREAKGVPSSLVLDLLGKLPKKRPSDVANERAADIAKMLRDDESSSMFNRIVIDAPKSRQISLVNFVRKITPYVHTEKGRLQDYTLEEQATIFNNYFDAIKQTFPDEWKRDNSVFFKTVGFGAMMNIFEKVFNECSTRYASFSVEDIAKLLRLVSDFDFSQWVSHGSGNKAEQAASADFNIDLSRALQRTTEEGKIKKLKL